MNTPRMEGLLFVAIALSGLSAFDSHAAYPVGVECGLTLKTAHTQFGPISWTELVCWDTGRDEYEATQNAPRSVVEGGLTGSGEEVKPYTDSKTDPDGDGLSNCFKDLTLNTVDNYHMDSGDIFSPDRIHPITGKETPHNGIDLQSVVGIPAYSVAFGYVSEVGFAGDGIREGNGNYVRVTWVNGSRSYEGTYIHLDSVNVARKDIVYPGTVIGYVGETGNVTGSHLHFELDETIPIISIDPITRKPTKVGEETSPIDPIEHLGGLNCEKLMEEE
ncbi:M23 family metallopeptidase [Idiomarina sp. ST10R2A5]|uniref:M23 family metallopeptidase n=1 Tax=Idiomarina sp. ST10R2A5 TaxID=3418368 RepID=UPI003EC6EA7B